MGVNQNNQTSETFTNNPLAPLFFEYVNILKAHHFHKEAEDLVEASEQYHLPENRIIVTKIVMEPIFRSKLLAKIVFANISNILYEKLKKLAHTAEYIRFELNISVFCMI